MTPFFQVHLRTRNVEAARDFYAAVLGRPPVHVVQLHEQAVARGAQPHWLGCLDVGDVDRAVAAFVERGATPLGPKWVNPEGLEAAVIRDPGGAIVALAKPPLGMSASQLSSSKSSGVDVVWHVLHTADVQRAKENYSDLFGWEFKPPFELEGFDVVAHPFAWAHGAAAVGALVDVGGRTGVHPHWLFHFRVTAIGASTRAVQATGGTVVGPFSLATGEQIAVCDDPQGAAFALWQGPEETR